MVCAPVLSDAAVKDPTPAEFNGAVPSDMPESRKVIVPVGVVPAGTPVTVAVNDADWP
jgi:hypothetical protein